MRFHAEIVARNEDGVLERILRVCRHRGFAPQNFFAVASPLEQTVHIEIHGSSQRPHVLLVKQLEKLHEVLSVTAHTRETQGAGPSLESRVRPAQVRRTVYASSSNG